MSTPDPKQGEREYFARVGEAEINRSLGKPFTNADCTRDLSNVAAIFHLLPPPPARIIELGCGVGWLSIMLARHGYETVGVDISPDAIAAGRAQAQALGLSQLQFQVADFESLTAADNSFDAAIFFSSLHHAEDETAAVANVHRVLKPGGMMIAFEPGTGHGEVASSRHAVETYGVHEKDMPVEKIVALGRRAGFRFHLQLPQPWDTLRILYRPSYGRARSSRDALGRFVLGVWRAFRRLPWRRRDQPFVVLWK